MSDQLQRLIDGGFKAAQLGNKDLASRAFKEALRLNPDHETALFGLALVSSDARERLAALRKLLQINPHHPQALSLLKRLGIEPERLLGSSPSSESSPPTPTLPDQEPATLEEPLSLEEDPQDLSSDDLSSDDLSSDDLSSDELSAEMPPGDTTAFESIRDDFEDEDSDGIWIDDELSFELDEDPELEFGSTEVETLSPYELESSDSSPEWDADFDDDEPDVFDVDFDDDEDELEEAPASLQDEFSAAFGSDFEDYDNDLDDEPAVLSVKEDSEQVLASWGLDADFEDEDDQPEETPASLQDEFSAAFGSDFEDYDNDLDDEPAVLSVKEDSEQVLASWGLDDDFDDEDEESNAFSESFDSASPPDLDDADEDLIPSWLLEDDESDEDLEPVADTAPATDLSKAFSATFDADFDEESEETIPEWMDESDEFDSYSEPDSQPSAAASLWTDEFDDDLVIDDDKPAWLIEDDDPRNEFTPSAATYGDEMDEPEIDFDSDLESDIDWEQDLTEAGDEGASAFEDDDEAIEIPVPVEPALEALPEFDFADLPPPVEGRDGIPIVDEQKITVLETMALANLKKHTETLSPDEKLNWQRKDSHRAGEREITILRAQIASVVIVIVGFLLLGGILLLTSVPEVQRVLFAPTASITPTPMTPTLTPTSTPGITPTPSPTPDRELSPTPKMDLSVTPGSLINTPIPTQLYRPGNQPVDIELVQAVSLIEAGQYDDAELLLRTLADQTENRGNAYPYFYLAEIQSIRGDYQSAIQALARGREVWENAPVSYDFDPLLKLGTAKVHFARAQETIANDSLNAATTDLREAEKILNEVRTQAPEMADAYILLADVYLAQDRLSETLQLINEVLTLPEFSGNIPLRLRKAEVFIRREEWDFALQELFEILYMDPYNRPAHEAQIQVAIAENDPGLAVNFIEQYLFFYPENIEAYRLLAQARILETKDELALQAYDQALSVVDTVKDYVNLMSDRATLYARNGQYALALRDLNDALSYVDDPALKSLRMQVAFEVDDFDQALEDADAIEGQNVLDQSLLDLYRARILIADKPQTDLMSAQESLNHLDQVVTSRLTPAQLKIWNETRAETLIRLGQVDQALTIIQGLIATEQSGRLRYMRGRIFESKALYPEALKDYTYVMDWDPLFAYSFTADAASHVLSVKQIMEQIAADATATAQVTPES